MSNFRPGDKLEALADKDGLTRGRIYTVVACASTDKPEACKKVRVFNDGRPFPFSDCVSKLLFIHATTKVDVPGIGEIELKRRK